MQPVSISVIQKTKKRNLKWKCSYFTGQRVHVDLESNKVADIAVTCYLPEFREILKNLGF